MEFQKIDLEVDGAGRSQNTEQRIARITSLFQSGQVRADVVREAILKLSRGVYVSEIETTRLVVKPMESVVTDQEIKQERAAAQAERAKAQGLTPRERPTI